MSPAPIQQKCPKGQKGKARAPRDCFFTPTIPGWDYHILKTKIITCPRGLKSNPTLHRHNSRRCCSWLTSPSASRTPPRNPFSSLGLYLPKTSSSLSAPSSFSLNTMLPQPPCSMVIVVCTAGQGNLSSQGEHEGKMNEATLVPNTWDMRVVHHPCIGTKM